MATRHNTCINPALANDASGWGDGGAAVPARTGVTGFTRSFAARYTASGFVRTPSGAAVAGQAHTVSLSVRPTNNSSGTIYAEWIDAGSNVLSYSSTSYTASAGIVTVISLTATAPANAAFVRIIVDGINFTGNTTDFTQVLIEQVSTLGTYFDGDSPSGSWDGTAGNSASTLSDADARTGTGTLTTSATVTSSGQSGRNGAAALASSAVLAASGSAARSGTALVAGVAVFAASGTAVVVASPVSSGWYGLLDILREASDLAQDDRARQPVACLDCGEPLRGGPNAELYCPFDGSQWEAGPTRVG